MQRVDDMAGPVFIKKSDLVWGERNEITLRNYEAASVRQMDGKRLKTVAQTFLDIIDDHK